MPVWGLTGGIASGKSTVRRMLAERGVHLIDADAVYHALIRPVEGVASPLAQRIEHRFPGVLEADGSLNRKVLGARVFSDPSERLALEELTHPAVAEAVGEKIRELRAAGVEHIFYDVPLLFERGLDKGMAGVVVVWAPRHLQLARLIQRDQLNAEEAEQRINAQMPIDKKRDRATWVIDNSGSLDETEAQVDEIWSEIVAKNRASAHA